MSGLLILGSIFLLTMLTIIKGSRIRNNVYSRYIIKKGKHYSYKNGIPFPYKIAVCGNRIKFRAIFADCEYDEDSVRDADDISKLYGINFGFGERKNSVRIGWNYNSNLGIINIYSYAYANGSRYWKLLASVAKGEEYQFVIAMVPNGDVKVVVWDRERYMIGKDTIKGVRKSWINFRLYPYFGGNSPAPRDLKIFIQNKRLRE